MRLFGAVRLLSPVPPIDNNHNPVTNIRLALLAILFAKK